MQEQYTLPDDSQSKEIQFSKSYHVVDGRLEAIPEAFVWIPNKAHDQMRKLGGEIVTFFTICSWHHRFGAKRRTIFTIEDLCELSNRSEPTVRKHVKALLGRGIVSYKDGIVKLIKFSKRINLKDAKACVPEYERSIYERRPEWFQVSKD